MSLKLNQLQSVVRETLKRERRNSNFRDELFRVLGPSVMVSEHLEKVAKAANEQLDVLEGTGRFPRQGSFKTAVLLEVADSPNSDVRKLVARLLPEIHVKRLLGDKSPEVRAAAAKRLPFALVREAVRRFPRDETIRQVARDKKLTEAGLPNAKPVDEPFDMYGEEPLGDAVKTFQGPDLPKSWYERYAQKLVKEYGNNLEGQWEEILAHNISKAEHSFGHEVDGEKLLKCIYDVIEEREDKVLDEGYFRRTAAKLKRESLVESFSIPIIQDDTSTVSALLEANLGQAAYLAEAEKVFDVRKSAIPTSLRKFSLREECTMPDMVPMVGFLPEGKLGAREERALDRYVESWNAQRAMQGEPVVLAWMPHAYDMSKIGFKAVLK